MIQVGDRVRTSIGLPEEVVEAVAGRGYCVVPLRNREALVGLAAEYRAKFGQEQPGEDGELVVEYMHPERDRARRLSSLIDPVVYSALDGVVTNFQILLSTAVVKYPGADSAMFLHEDRSFVDEAVDRSLTLWVPLADTGPSQHNGGLEVVPWSHLLGVLGSGSATPEPFRAYEAWLRERLVAVEVPLGQALLYDSRLLHASGPNLSETPRIALVVSLISASAEALHLRGVDRRSIAVHPVDRSFYWDHLVRDVEREMPAGYPRSRTLTVDPPAARARAEAAVAEMADRLGVPRPTACPWVPEEILEPPEGVTRWSSQRADAMRLRADVAPRELAPGGSPPARGVVPILQADPAPVSSDGASRVAVDPRTVQHPRGAHLRDAEVWTVPPRQVLSGTLAVTPRWRTVAHVQASPGFGAGIARAEGGVWPVAELDEGGAVDLPQGERLTVWNMGPGPLAVLVVRELRPEASVLDRVYARARRRLTALRRARTLRA